MGYGLWVMGYGEGTDMLYALGDGLGFVSGSWIRVAVRGRARVREEISGSFRVLVRLRVQRGIWARVRVC